jgi:hypothetical protein
MPTLHTGLALGASIHGFFAAAQVVDARDKHGHDGESDGTGPT